MFAKKARWITRARWTRPLFVERQILLTARGRVSYFSLGARTQMSLGLAGAAAVALLGYGAAKLIEQPIPPRQSAAVATLVGPAPRVEGVAVAEALGQQLEAMRAQLADAREKLASRTEAEARLEAQIEAQALASRAAPATAAAPEPPKTAALDELQGRIKHLEAARDQAVVERDEVQRQLAALQESANERLARLGQLNKALEAKSGELRQSDAQRTALQARLRQLEADLDGANTHIAQYRAGQDGVERKLQTLAAERDKVKAERDRLESRVAELETRLSALSGRGISPGATPKVVTDRPAEQHSSNGPLGEIERLIASTGIDLGKLLGNAHAPEGQGGPYVALDRTKRLGQDTKRELELRAVLKTLPLASPLAQYQLESGFGARSDPFHRRQAFHTGIDLSAPYRSPVFSTAPGTVVFAGVKEGYGKVVEIDHGHGIVTRYAHLHRAVVATGANVHLHQQVGELGSTGRSTGPHLHYEVVVEGTPQDPGKFLEAGKNVVQVGR